jgi:hypothetical protein
MISELITCSFKFSPKNNTTQQWVYDQFDPLDSQIQTASQSVSEVILFQVEEPFEGEQRI